MAHPRVDKLAGIPLFYDRFSDDSYGKQGKPYRPYVEAGFLVICEYCFKEMQALFTPGGFAIGEIWSGGVGRSGSGSSLHHQNRAFDLDALVFSDKPMWVADTFPQRPFLYLAIEAVLRIHFGTVLNYDYNAAHEDHFHFDNGTNVGFKRAARSHVLFLQHSLTKLFDKDVGTAGVDGVYGDDTEAALTDALNDLGIGTITNTGNWETFLRACCAEALALETQISQP